jgi:hypothetical protein
MTDLIPYRIDYLAYQLQITNKILFLILLTFAIPKIIAFIKYISRKKLLTFAVPKIKDFIKHVFSKKK